MRVLATKAAIGLALGLLTTVATAWAIAWKPPELQSDGYGKRRASEARSDPFPRKWYVHADSGRGMTRVRILVDVGREPPEALEPAFRRLTHPAPIRRALRENADRLLMPQAEYYDYTFTSFGWPARSLYFEEPFARDRAEVRRSFDGRPDPTAVRPIEPLEPSRFAEPSDPFGLAGAIELGGVSLPIRPLWTGLAINALTFGSLWIVLLAGPGAIIRHRRRVRGRCTACGYDRRGLTSSTPCPECGRQP